MLQGSDEDGMSEIGSVHTNENEDSEEDISDKENNGDEDDSNLDGNDDDGLLHYLFDKDSRKQHLFAILVALAASSMSYFHILSEGDNSSNAGIPVPVPTKPVMRKEPLKSSKAHHHHGYRRTEHLFFCPVDLSFPSEKNQERIEKAIAASKSYSNVKNANDIDPNLKLFQFNFPKQYIDIINDYFIADEIMDDFYNKTLTSDEGMTDDPSFQCLVDGSIANQQKSTVPMNSIAYIHPDINTFYHGESHNDAKNDLSVRSILDTDYKEEKKTPVSLTYTGFTAKFINLSTKDVNLFWDGKTKPKFRARIPPFESFTTVTIPGSSFYVAPTYDKDHAMERWTMTADEAVVAYDVLSNDKEIRESLSIEERKMFEMQKLNLAYSREYLATTHRSWLSMFPRALNMHYMWDTSYFGQEHLVNTKQTHFLSLPTDKKGAKEVWRMLDYKDYDRMKEESEKSGKQFLNLQRHREEGTLALKLKAISVAPRVFEIENFLSNVEADHLIEMAKIYDVTGSEANARTKKKTTGAATNAWIRREMSPIVDAIYHRSADVLKIDESLLRHRNEYEHSELNTHHSIAEAIHLSRFTKEQGYQPRSDAAQASLKNRYQPSRFATIMFFLNDITGEEQGGDTAFPLAVNAHNHDGIRVQPKKGKALVVYNMLPDGNVDDLSQHSSTSVMNGEKWFGTLFVWDPIID